MFWLIFSMNLKLGFLYCEYLIRPFKLVFGETELVFKLDEEKRGVTLEVSRFGEVSQEEAATSTMGRWCRRLQR